MADTTFKKVIAEIAQEEGISDKKVLNYINSIFRVYKQKLRLNTLPTIRMRGFLLARPSIDKIGDRTLSGSLGEKAIERLEKVADRLFLEENMESSKEKYRMAKKWEKFEKDKSLF